MDESWRMRMGVGMTSKPNFPRRKATEATSHRAVIGDYETLEPEDFNDVFGGPPRSVLYSQFTGGCGESTRSPTLFYEEIFRPSEDKNPAARIGRTLKEFRIPEGRGGRRIDKFYSDIFQLDEDVRRSRSRSKSMSKSTSSSILSSEELSPLRPAIGDDDISFSSFASKLRPINIPARWNSSAMMHEEYPSQQGMPSFSCNRPSYVGSQFVKNEFIENPKSSQSGFSRQVPSTETISLEPGSYGSIKICVDDQELNSPSSAVSSLCEDQEVNACKMEEKAFQEQDMEQEEDEVMSSYVIEINSDHREATVEEALGIDEAIAWAKERFQRQSSDEDCCMRQHEKNHSVEVKERPNAHQYSDGQIDGHESVCSPEVEQMDENIRLWSSGKEANIRLLLSTLHHILWPDSGWCAISLMNLLDSSSVKRAYQKARLCLHPDKLQQRCATVSQKYVAEKAFSILQDAWAAFISQDVILS